MYKRFVLFLTGGLLVSSSLFAQKYYMATSGEMIFSYGVVSGGDADIKAVVRWSPVFNGQLHLHLDFTKSFGIYTGIGLRNVGLISKLNYITTDVSSGSDISKTVTVKERSYSFGLPVALKLGNMGDQVYLAAGGELELMFAYKRKIIDGDSKNKVYSFFDDRVNILNPSVFGEVHFPGGTYIRFKYYLLDFLNYEGITLIDGTFIPQYGETSPLFYLSLGNENIIKKPDHNKQPANGGSSAYFRSREKDLNENVFMLTPELK